MTGVFRAGVIVTMTGVLRAGVIVTMTLVFHAGAIVLGVAIPIDVKACHRCAALRELC